MKLTTPVAILASLTLPSLATSYAQEAARAAPLNWAVAVDGPLEILRSPSTAKRPLSTLGRGAAVEVFQEKRHGNEVWVRVRAVDPATMEVVAGWARMRNLKVEAPGQFPPDAALLKAAGGVYLDDFNAAHTEIGRYVLFSGNPVPGLICFLGSRTLPQTRLQVFQLKGGHIIAGPYLELAASEPRASITHIEVRDLLGDGHECLVTEEPFSFQTENGGENMVIRRVEGDELKTLWQAPIELRNLTSFPAHYRVLAPPEKNIGAAGTVTTATVEFRSRGAVSDPVWKGQIDFYVPGRAEPLDSVKVEKQCPWDGKRFVPVR